MVSKQMVSKPKDTAASKATSSKATSSKATSSKTAHDQVTVTDAEYARAVAAGQGPEPRAQSVHFDRRTKRLQIELQDGIAILIPTALIQGLSQASAAEIEGVELLADGYALYWPALDADVTVPGLVVGVFGTRQWMRQIAADFLSDAGRKGGRVKTPAKRAASRANGRLGGRPRKHVTA